MRPTGAEVLVLARTQIGKPYVFGVDVDLTHPDPPAFDCAEFASWVHWQKLRRLVGCTDNGVEVRHAEPYSGGWARDAREGVLTRVPFTDAFSLPGCVLIRAPGRGAIGHVALSDGEGGTVEAHSTRLGVCERRNAMGRRWDYAGLVPGVSYQPTRHPPTLSGPPPVLRVGSRGPKVGQLQAALGSEGFDPGPVDGEFGPRTRAAVVAFQVARGLLVDGEVGPETGGALGLA